MYTIQSFKQLGEKLLKKHFGLELGDTRLCEDDYVAALIESSVEPFEYINEFAEDCGLDRIDSDDFAPKGPLTETDQAAA